MACPHVVDRGVAST